MAGSETIEMVDHPSHYGGEDNPYETIKVLEAWYGTDAVVQFCLMNSVKYLSRAGKKSGESNIRDLNKAKWYIEYAITKEGQTNG